ncbi:hypothetical protein E2562_026935 [Oryza meyeriana var. granulata]|uniref:Uncharacterized protein n=1 Tax=Oryza meyeriana var. granulata TaxID=110450 RepID=A0A6G1EZB7_9ORYZ|nr:hypothetical protein E2562_026935 [Oryza meyeriana var. granulata]
MPRLAIALITRAQLLAQRVTPSSHHTPRRTSSSTLPPCQGTRCRLEVPISPLDARALMRSRAEARSWLSLNREEMMVPAPHWLGTDDEPHATHVVTVQPWTLDELRA